MNKPEIKDRFQNLKAWAGPVFVLVMLIAALWFLHLELREHSLKEFKDGLFAIPTWKLLLAVFFTLLNYAILVCYDWLGIWYIRHPMKFRRVALASFLGYSVGNNFGLLFGGSTIRYRLYSTWGLSAAEIVKLLFILAITFWIGLFALSGLVFLIDPLPMPDVIKFPMATTRPLGIVLTTLAVGYLIVCFRRRPLKIGRKAFHPPPFGLSLLQYTVAAIDLLVAAAIVYVLLPESVQLSYFNFVGIFLLAQVAVFVTQVPGGLGVLEASLLTLLPIADEAKPAVFAALMAYRLIFYLTPMVIGIALLAVHEVVTSKEQLKKAFDWMGIWTPDIAPRIAAVVIFICGVSMVFTAALPVLDARMVTLNAYLPLWFIELNYFACGVIGVLLLLLSRALYRRISSAYQLTLATLILAIACTFFGSLGYTQIVILLLALFMLTPIRHYFHRRGKLVTDQIAFHWLSAIAAVLVLSIWLFWFAYKKSADFGFDFWTVALDADAPRSWRAVLGATVMGVGFYLVRVLQISIGRPESTTHLELSRARKIVSASSEPNSNLALLGDKRLLFNESNTAMIAYGIHGNSCVALGNPVGNTADVIQLAWDFCELCSQQENWPVFYLVDDRYASLYQEMNLQLIHIGDEALVDLRRLDLEDNRYSLINESRNVMQQRGYRFRMVNPGPGDPLEISHANAVEALLPDLERISSAWQQDRGGPELRFSISFFNNEFVKKNPLALVEFENRIVAFSSVWQGAEKDEFTTDLVRHLPDQPAETLDFLLAELMLAAKQQGYRFFNLGMAPLSSEQLEANSRYRKQMMSLAFRFSRHFYSYQGLRNYKERFAPNWRPCFLAFPAKRPLDVILNDVALLIGSVDVQQQASA